MNARSYGATFKKDIADNEILPLIGVHDVFSAGLAGRYGHIFISGFGFAASHYGLPDIGFIAWPDLVDFVRRVRHILPTHHILVDIDDGYCDPAVAVQASCSATQTCQIGQIDSREPARNDRGMR